MKRMILVCLVLSACADGDAPPRGAVEVDLAVMAVMGPFDPNKGRTFSSVISVVIDGEEYTLQMTEDPKIVGEPGAPPMFLGGRKVIVKGEIRGDEYYASYLKWLPADSAEEPTVTLGVPR